MLDLKELGKRSQAASKELAKLSQEKKNTAILNAAKALVENSECIIKENAKDVKNAGERGVSPAMIDRLRVDESRIRGMAEGLEQVCSLADPVGEVTGMTRRPNGLLIGSQRVPLGVIGMIYESRPNVTADAFGLCFKTGNSVILKGGSDAINSNIAITKVIREALEKSGVTPDAVILIEDTSREVATELMRLNEYLDVLIPRGGYGLIKTVVENSTVPVIETGTGNCHIFVDETADLEMAVKIIVNAKTQRMGVCNACESLVVHKNVAEKAIPVICDALTAKNVEIRGCEISCKLDNRVIPATEEDWGTEYLDAIISLKTVDGLDEAIEHINRYNTGHSEAIITSDYASSQRFINEIDAAAVYVNASTRFTDGFEFGYGAEIGISTQKLHARGPMGLLALTTTKNIIYGSGQVRE